MLRVNLFLSSQISSLFIFYSSNPAHAWHTQKALKYWLNEFLRAVFKHIPNFTLPNRFPSSFPFWSWLWPSSWDVGVPCLNVHEGEGGTNHCCQAVDTLAWGGIRGQAGCLPASRLHVRWPGHQVRAWNLILWQVRWLEKNQASGSGKAKSWKSVRRLEEYVIDQ